MAFFGVTIEQIESLRPIKDADKIEVATLKGMTFQIVVGKGMFSVGDCVLYFPIDSLLPVDVQKVLGLEGKLSGPEKNRVITRKFKGEISQGIVGKIWSFDYSKIPEAALCLARLCWCFLLCCTNWIF